jgi:hypothetical protein
VEERERTRIRKFEWANEIEQEKGFSGPVMPGKGEVDKRRIIGCRVECD